MIITVADNRLGKIMKHFIPFVASLVICSTAVSASDTATIYYETLSIDLSVGAASVKAADMTGMGIGGTIPIDENLFLVGSYSKVKGDILTLSSSLSVTTFGLGYHLFNDLDLEAGTGSKLSTLLSYNSSKIKVKVGSTEYSGTDTGTLVGLGYTTALGENFSADLSFNGLVDDFKPAYTLGASYKVGSGAIRAAYSATEEVVEGVTIKASGWNLGYSFVY